MKRKPTSSGKAAHPRQGKTEPGAADRQGPDSPTRPASLAELRRRIADRGSGQSQVFRLIAEYLLDHAPEAAMASMREIAQRLSVDPSNLVRFAKSFGFSGYNELRQLLQAEVKASAEPGSFLERAARLQQRTGGRAGTATRLLVDIQAAHEANIAALIRRNQPEVLITCGRMLARARSIHVCGMRSCFAAAFAFAYAARMVRSQVRLMDGLAGTFADSLREIGERDILLVIGMEPYSAASVKAVAYAHERGARIIAVTDSALSPLARGAEVILEFRRDGPQIPGTVAPAVALVEMLAAAMIARGGRRFLETLRASEEQLARFGAYVREGNDMPARGKTLPAAEDGKG
ncbi:MAG: MurR/RpiR family transcriptional regulator [Alphaproteobacteria bacterium]|nr:MAG: MurR/RpiR family transcriptional regulator [Alphaproteobacteria bacterium]